MKIKLGEKHTSLRGWSRDATLEDGRMFRVSVTRGRRRRIAYKPRGQNIGFDWWAAVLQVELTGESFPRTVKRFEQFLVNKSNGVRGILKMALGDEFENITKEATDDKNQEDGYDEGMAQGGDAYVDMMYGDSPDR